MKSPIEKKLIKARTSLLMEAPFFGSLALKLKLLPDPTIPTAWTDGIYLGYNPEYIKHLPMSQLTGLIAHEVMHLALCHHTRQGKRDHGKWNRAGDHAINHLLQGAGFDLPLNVLLEPRFTGMSAEAIYDQLLETYDTTLEVIYADRKVRGQETFTKADLPLTLKPKGGGGTDFRPVFDLVEKQGMAPCCLVYLTDLCCDRFPNSPPAYPVLWVNTETFRWDDPPFGTVIDME